MLESTELPDTKRVVLEKSRPGSLVRRTSESPAPLSFAQEQIWVHSQMTSAPIYNDCLSLHLPGQLDVAALEQSLNELLRRHEILRTTFPAVDGQPVQMIHPPSVFHLPLLDLRSLPAFEREAEALRIARERLRQPFNVAQWPLFRVWLVRLGEEEYRLFFVAHHLIVDGVALYQAFLPELGALYQACSQGQPSPLAEARLQYADYALWQREQMPEEMLAEHLAYWKQQLADIPPILALPTDHTRPSHWSYRGGVKTFVLPQRLTLALKELSRQEGVTFFNAVVASLNTLLYRYTGQEDMVIGTVTAGRRQPEVRRLVGCFINPVVLRNDLSGNPSFRDLLKKTSQTTRRALEHSKVPFVYLVKELHPERAFEQNPFYQVVVIMEPGLAGLPPGWSASHFEVTAETAKVDLSLALSERPEGITCNLEYSTDLFEEATIERMIGHWQTLLASVVAHPDQPIATLPLLTEPERHQLLVEWNRTFRDVPLDRPFAPLFEEQAKQAPNAPAAICDGKQVTYQELNRQANRLARILVEAGVGPDVLVALLAERSIDFLTVILAVFKAGGAYLPLDPRHPPKRHAQVLGQSKSRLVLTTSEFVSVLSQALDDVAGEDPPVILLIEEALQEERSEENLPTRSTPDNLAYVIYTSGSTGMPKGAMVEQRGMVNHLFAKILDLDLTERDIVAQTASQCFDISVWQFLAALLVGGRVHIFQDEVAFDALRLLKQVGQHKISVLETVPSLLRAMLEGENRDGLSRSTLAALRWLIPTGEALPPELCRQWLSRYPSIPLVNAYGPTECSDDVTHYPIYLPPAPDVVQMPIGRPIINTQMYVLDPRLQPVPVGVVGELYVGGVGVGRGYLHAPEKTTQAFQKNPFAQEPEARLYKTGDLARYLPDGNIEYLGRVDHQVKIRGFRIELGEIETVLAQHPAIGEVVVVAREDRPGDTRLAAYLVPAGDQFPYSEDLRAFLKDRLPEYMIPAAWVVLEALPQTPNGKIDRKALPAPETGSQPSQAGYVPPTEIEQYQLLHIWEELLDVRPIGIRDNFFFLGGHSLLAARMLARTEEVFGKKLSLATLFTGPTIEELVRALHRSEEISSRAPVYAIQTGNSKPPIFFLHGDLAGGGFYCYHLARELGADQPFYALEPYRIEGLPVPPTFEEVAQAHVEAIRSIQPEGPYLLGGFCNGALFAGEMSRQLHAQGQQVKLLFMVDPDAPVPIPQRLISKFFHRLGSGLRLGRDKQFDLYLRFYQNYSYLREIIRQVISRDYREIAIKNRGKRDRLGLALPSLDWLTAPLEKLREDRVILFHWAGPDRLPELHANVLAFVWTAEGEVTRRPWDRLTGERTVDVQTVPYAHSEWTPESIQMIAAHFRRNLRKVGV